MSRLVRKCDDCGTPVSATARRCRHCNLSLQLKRGAIIDPMNQEMEELLDKVLEERKAAVRAKWNWCPSEDPETNKRVLAMIEGTV